MKGPCKGGCFLHRNYCLRSEGCRIEDLEDESFHQTGFRCKRKWDLNSKVAIGFVGENAYGQHPGD